MKPATKVGTHHGLFSGRSYDVGFGPNDSDFPQHAIENKVLPSENSGGWQTIRGFLGATLLTAVDSNQNPNTNYHAVLVLPTSEYSRDTRSMRCLKATVGKQLELVIEPSIASTDKTGFHEAYNEHFTVIKPKTRSSKATTKTLVLFAVIVSTTWLSGVPGVTVIKSFSITFCAVTTSFIPAICNVRSS